MRAKPTIIAKLLTSWTAFLLIFSWLPLVRCVLDGGPYSWGTAHFGFSFSAIGIGPDLWLTVFKSIALVYLMWGLLRGSNPIHRALLLLWNVAWFVDGTLDFVRNPEGMMFHGETLGIHLNIGVVIPALTGFYAILTLIWFVRESKRAGTRPRPDWTTYNRRFLATLLLLLPLQFVLLRFGAPHGATDAIGVFLTIGQCLVLPAALYPRACKR